MVKMNEKDQFLELMIILLCLKENSIACCNLI